MLEIEDIEKLSDEELKQYCDISYSKDPKGKEMKVISYPKAEDYKMRDEQIQSIARFICDNIGDVRKYIDDNKEEYEKWVEKNQENLFC